MGSDSSDRVPTGSTIPDPASVEAHGRTWTGYGEGKYLLPNDGAEQDRLDLQHAMWLLIMDGQLAWAPVREPANVLDIGTGTGVWAIQFADEHPKTKVIGTDLSLIQPTSHPPNCSFIREDVDDPWLFRDVPFDYIHLRLMWSLPNPKQVVQKVFNHLRPGGWVEYQASSETWEQRDHNINHVQDLTIEVLGEDPVMESRLRDDPNGIWQWTQRMKQAGAMFGRDFEVPRKYKNWLIEAGFVDVTEELKLVPLGPWPQDPKDRRLGAFNAANVLEGLEGASLRTLQALGLSEPQIRTLIDGAAANVRDSTLHTYCPMYVVYGRKPVSEELSKQH